MKAFVYVLMFFISQAAFAEGKCVSLPDMGAHESFCAGLSESACSTHNSMCEWEKSKVKNLKIIENGVTKSVKVIEETEHACVAKEGQ